MDDMDDIVEEFLEESYENLDRLDLEFVELESDPDSTELLASIFRTIHTIKGTSGFFGFSNLESLSHAGENLLSLLRDGKITLRVEITNALLAMVDAIRSILEVVADNGTDGTNSFDALTGELHRLSDPDAATTSSDEPAATASDEAVPEATPDPIAVEATAATMDDKATDAASTKPPATEAKAGHSDTSIRVDVKLLDRLMNLVGELVLARNQVLQFHASQDDPGFQGTSQQLDLITTELQEGVMQTRMQPIGNVWTKFPRIVRDLSASLGKSVELEMVGKETELDKTLIEAIKDPLTHIVRNSVDHGIETPEDRLAAGKPETGILRLYAYHEGGQVIIEISDDGAGLNLERIRSKAVSQGLVSQERALSMSDRDVANMVFRAGFSTAEKVTNVSGRGVGMDVVKTNVEKIGGSLDIQTAEGRGTTLIIKIPLTLAIIPALIITCDGNRYLIPQVNLVELLYVEPDSATPIENIGDAEVYRLRGTLLPIVHLREILGLPPQAEAADDGVEGPPASEIDPSEIDPSEIDHSEIDHSEIDHSEIDPSGIDPSGIDPSGKQRGHGRSIVVLQADGHQFGLVVDKINDTEEIVVKPLSAHLKALPAYAGTTILGDGAVALILDALGIARVSGAVREGDGGVDDTKEDSDERRSTIQTVLVARVGADRIAVPLGLVARLEEFDRKLIEQAAGRDVIQYRGRLLTLVHLGELLDKPPVPDEEPNTTSIRVLVYESEDQVYGFVVDEILDVFEADLNDSEPALIPGLDVSCVIGRRVTDMIDIDELIRIAENAPAPIPA